MKLYSFQPAPNPRRARIFIAEKGLEIPVVEVNLRERAQDDPEFRRRNPAATVPLLELDDGTCIGETLAICRYLEELHPDPALLGHDPVERAMVEWWNRRVEFEGMMAIAEALRNHSEFFVDRALPGPYRIPQVPELARRGVDRARQFFGMLEARLAEATHVAGEAYSMADISAFVTVEFASWVKLDALADHPSLAAWHERISERPAAQA